MGKRNYIHLYHGNASLLAESLEAIQQTSSFILAALEPNVSDEMPDAELAVPQHRFPPVGTCNDDLPLVWLGASEDVANLPICHALLIRRSEARSFPAFNTRFCVVSDACGQEADGVQLRRTDSYERSSPQIQHRFAKVSRFANEFMKQSFATSGLPVCREGSLQGTQRVLNCVFQIRHRGI